MSLSLLSVRFNTQPPEGGWFQDIATKHSCLVSTHSRLKAAGAAAGGQLGIPIEFQHTAA